MGFTGNTCKIDINDCDPNPCLNGGLCQDMIGKYECICDDRFSGKECQGKITIEVYKQSDHLFMSIVSLHSTAIAVRVCSYHWRCSNYCSANANSSAVDDSATPPVETAQKDESFHNHK